MIKNNYNQGEGGAGGIAIFIKKSLKVQELDLTINKKNFDILGIKIKTDVGEISIIEIYRRPIGTEERNTWCEIINEIDRKSNDNIIIAGDMNAYYIMWNCEDMDRNEEKLYEEMEEKDLFIINHDTK